MMAVVAVMFPVVAALAFLAGRRVEALVWRSQRNAYHRSLAHLVKRQAAQRAALTLVVDAVDSMAQHDHTMSTDATDLVYAAMCARRTL